MMHMIISLLAAETHCCVGLFPGSRGSLGRWVGDYLTIAMVRFAVGGDPSGPKISEIHLPAVFSSEFHRLVLRGPLEKNAPKRFDAHLRY
jgi:hypothetical protein